MFYLFITMQTIATILLFNGGYDTFAETKRNPDQYQEDIYDYQMERNTGQGIGLDFDIPYMIMHSLYMMSIIPLLLILDPPSPTQIIEHCIKKFKSWKNIKKNVD